MVFRDVISEDDCSRTRSEIWDYLEAHAHLRPQAAAEVFILDPAELNL